MDNDRILAHMHQLHLVLADEVKRICDKYEIKYFLLAGTLLGAVRHGGIIPWDDDMDFGMLRPDFEKFLSVCDDELDAKRFYLQTDRKDKYYTFNYAKLRLKGTKVLETFSSKVNTNQGIYIDISPLDAISDNPIKAAIQYKGFYVFRNLLWVKCGYGGDDRRKQFSYKAAMLIGRFFTIKFLKTMKYKIITWCREEKTNRVVTSDGTYGLKKETLKREWVEKLRDYTLDGHTYSGIADYDAYLRYLYVDYMKIPPKDQRDHHRRLEVDFGDY